MSNAKCPFNRVKTLWWPFLALEKRCRLIYGCNHLSFHATVPLKLNYYLFLSGDFHLYKKSNWTFFARKIVYWVTSSGYPAMPYWKKLEKRRKNWNLLPRSVSCKKGFEFPCTLSRWITYFFGFVKCMYLPTEYRHRNLAQNLIFLIIIIIYLYINLHISPLHKNVAERVL